MNKVIEQTAAVPIAFTKKKKLQGKGFRKIFMEAFAVLLTVIVFGIPFYFVIINAVKNTQESSLLTMKWPSSFHLIENIKEVLAAQDGMVEHAFVNSILIT